MALANRAEGYLRSGLPYNRFGLGPRPLFIFRGLQFENEPFTRFGWIAAVMYRFLEEDYTVYMVGLRPGMPPGYSMSDMANDYATAIRQEIGQPVDVIGVSTGGSVALHFAADHPGLVSRLVIHSSAHALGAAGKEAQMGIAHLARQGRWREAYALLLDFFLPSMVGHKALVRLGSRLMSLGEPRNPSDLVVTVEAEDRHGFQGRLAEITAPTLVIAGTEDPAYPEALVRETAAGIHGAQLVLYERMGHPAHGKQFERDVLTFLRARPS